MSSCFSKRFSSGAGMCWNAKDCSATTTTRNARDIGHRVYELPNARRAYNCDPYDV